MKIVHVIIAAAYKEGYGYQENILPAKHVELGLDTYVVTYGKGYPNGVSYVNEDGVRVTMLPINDSKLSRIRYISSFSKKTKDLLAYLEHISPDIIFVHGLQAIDILSVSAYCDKHPDIKLFVDQHADYYNTPIDKFTSRLFYKYVYGYIARRLSRHAIKFWGVTPWRVDYLQKVYRLKPEKTDILVMGGDEKLIDWDNRDNIRKEIRLKYNIPANAFLIITGGKIDKAKNIHLLIDAVQGLKSENVFLLVFGNMTKDMEAYCSSKFKDNIIYLGWLESKDVYPYFLSSDLAFFPGTHSVLWEQAMACGIPGVFKDWDGGFSHMDCGGNAILHKDMTIKTIQSIIVSLLKDPEKYLNMKYISENVARKVFSYIEIAKKSIYYDKL